MASVVSFPSTYDLAKSPNPALSLAPGVVSYSAPDDSMNYLPNWLTASPSVPAPHLPSFPRNPAIENGSIIVMMILLSVFASIRFASVKYLAELFETIYKKGTIARLFREKVSNLSHVSYRLDLLFVLTSGVLLYHFITINPIGQLPGPSLLVLLCTVSFLGFIVSKFTLYRISGWLFDSDSETQEYIFYAKTGNRLLGIFLLPIALILFFTGILLTKILLTIAVAIIGIISIINVSRGIAIIAKKVFSIYYIILYLCTLEILPLLLVWRIVWRNFE
ncbi:MAG TPA: DUF4271 domain-containing protein [Prolixibacteraceae bacterium]|nr:DUF4271 domain-containing protein [Prolixibacteraceae bacterium]